MRVTKIYCDHCGKELNPMNDYCDLTIEISVRPGIDIDLCEDCLDNLYRNIVNFAGKRMING